MEAEELCMYDGEGRKRRRGGGILLSGMDQKWVWRWKRGISLDISLARKARRLRSPFSRGCTEPFKGRERGRRIALG